MMYGILLFLDNFKPLDLNGYIRLKGLSEVTLNDSKLDWLLKGSVIMKEVILMKVLCQSTIRTYSE